MINAELVSTIVNQNINPAEEFVVEVSVSSSNRILVVLDSEKGITIDRCVAVSRAIEQQFDRDKEDFELEVASAGLSQPLKVLRQFKKNIGREVEVVLQKGDKVKGKLVDAKETDFTIEIQEMIKLEDKKKKQLITRLETLSYNEVKSVTVVISFR